MYQPKTNTQTKVPPNLWTPITTQNPYTFPSQLLKEQLTTPFPGSYSPYTHVPNNIPIINNYNISVGGPEVDHIRLSSIFEDMLPMDKVNETYNSVSERLTLNDYIRSVFIRKMDGEDIDLEGGGNGCLVSYLKFLQLNPNSTSAYSINPYKNLPDNMLIYKSCYPIRYDPKTLSVACAKNSVGLNIRIYRMSLGEYYVKRDSRKGYQDYDLWREIAWYEYVRENILKRKHSPNFVNFYAYFINEKSKIDFDKVAYAKDRNRYSKQLVTGQKGGYTIVPQYHKQLNPSVPVEVTGKLEQMENNPDAYSGKALVALTESPNFNLYEWASKVYELDGNIKRMINTGFHTERVWFSVIFQIMSALYTLQKHKIAFRNFKVDENIYIKELSYHDNVNTFWKYVVDGVEFYVPNQGYLVLFDSNFKNLNKSSETVIKSEKKNRFKIYTNKFGGLPYKEDHIDKLCFKAFLETVGSNTFSESFINAGGVRPPESVLRLLERINAEANDPSSPKNIGYYITTYMTMFMNNRIGTYLDENEVLNIRRNDTRTFRKGEIVVQETEADSYKFVMYVGDGRYPGKSLVLTKDDDNFNNNDLIEQDVSNFNIHHYSRFEKITQKFNPGEAALNEENMIEVYRI